jgi:hypothetical protein
MESGLIQMQRRKFFNVLGGLAAQSAAMSLPGEKQAAFGSSSPSAEQAAGEQDGATAAAAGFDEYTEGYPAFCEAPENERTFYALHDGRIVSERLNNDGWKSKLRWPPPKLPMLGGSHDGVPMISPIPDLAGEGPHKPI